MNYLHVLLVTIAQDLNLNLFHVLLAHTRILLFYNQQVALV